MFAHYLSQKKFLRKPTKRAITLIELMIVIVLIGLITGAIAYNYQGTLEKGKAFATEQKIEKIRTVLMMELSMRDREEVLHDWPALVQNSPLISPNEHILQDAWGQNFQVDIMEDDRGLPVIHVTSEALERYRQRTGDVRHSRTSTQRN